MSKAQIFISTVSAAHTYVQKYMKSIYTAPKTRNNNSH